MLIYLFCDFQFEKETSVFLLLILYFLLGLPSFTFLLYSFHFLFMYVFFTVIEGIIVLGVCDLIGCYSMWPVVSFTCQRSIVKMLLSTIKLLKEFTLHDFQGLQITVLFSLHNVLFYIWES